MFRISKRRSVAFVVVAEPGKLEAKALAAVSSLRKNSGLGRNALIISVQPRHSGDLHRSTLIALKKLKVLHIKLPINSSFSIYGMANKPFAGAYIENTFADLVDQIVLLDSDLLILGELESLLLKPGKVCAVKPTDGKNVGILHGQPYDEFWQSLFAFSGVPVPEKPMAVTTTETKEEINAYFNSGVIAVDPNLRIFSRWADGIRAVGKEKRWFLSLPERERFFVEQAMFAVTLAGCVKPREIQLIEPELNYPLNYRKTIESSKVKILHYHSEFDALYDPADPAGFCPKIKEAVRNMQAQCLVER